MSRTRERAPPPSEPYGAVSLAWGEEGQHYSPAGYNIPFKIVGTGELRGIDHATEGWGTENEDMQGYGTHTAFRQAFEQYCETVAAQLGIAEEDAVKKVRFTYPLRDENGRTIRDKRIDWDRTPYDIMLDPEANNRAIIKASIARTKDTAALFSGAICTEQ